MKITYDPAKRQSTLREREIDFEHAALVFAGLVFEEEDTRFDYGERRMRTIGYLVARMVTVVWTPRGDDTRHIISMRKCNEREQKIYRHRLEEI